MALNATRLGAAMSAACDAALDALITDDQRSGAAGVSPAQASEMRAAKYKALAQAIVDEFTEHAVVTVTGVESGGDTSGPGTVE